MHHRWTDEDRAFAAAQYASGIRQIDIEKAFGYPARGSRSSVTCKQISTFMEKYTNSAAWRWTANDHERRMLIKQALATFIEQRIPKEDMT